MIIGNSLLKKNFNNYFLIILLGSKLLFTILCLSGCIRNDYFLGTTVYSLLFLLAWSFSTYLTNIHVLLIGFLLLMIVLTWIISYVTFCVSAKKKRLTSLILLLLTIIDGICAIISMIRLFSVVALSGVIFNAILVALLITSIAKENACTPGKDFMSRNA